MLSLSHFHVPGCSVGLEGMGHGWVHSTEGDRGQAPHRRGTVWRG